MSKGFRRTAAGVGLALTLALFATPATQAAPSRARRAGRTVQAAPSPSLFSVLWSYLVGGDPGVHMTQGPTVDPNGNH
jgi:hypothetical protein